MIQTGTAQKTETVPIKNSSDVVMVRQRVRALAIEMKFSLVEQTKIVQQPANWGGTLWNMAAGDRLSRRWSLTARGAASGSPFRIRDRVFQTSHSH